MCIFCHPRPCSAHPLPGAVPPRILTQLLFPSDGIHRIRFTAFACPAPPVLCKHRTHSRPGPPPPCHLLCPCEVLPVPPPHPWEATRFPQDPTVPVLQCFHGISPLCLNQACVLLWLGFTGSEPTLFTETNSDNDLFPSSDPCPHEVSVSKSSRERLSPAGDTKHLPGRPAGGCGTAGSAGLLPREGSSPVPARAAGSWTSRCSRTPFPPGFRSHPSWWPWPGQPQPCPAATCG